MASQNFLGRKTARKKSGRVKEVARRCREKGEHTVFKEGTAM